MRRKGRPNKAKADYGKAEVRNIDSFPRKPPCRAEALESIYPFRRLRVGAAFRIRVRSGNESDIWSLARKLGHAAYRESIRSGHRFKVRHAGCGVVVTRIV